jgi:hypothetical protein
MRLALDLEAAPEDMPAEELVDFAEGCVDECFRHGVLAPGSTSTPTSRAGA